MDTRSGLSGFHRWLERFLMNCSRAWAKECTEFTSNPEQIVRQTNMPRSESDLKNYS